MQTVEILILVAGLALAAMGVLSLMAGSMSDNFAAGYRAQNAGIVMFAAGVAAMVAAIVALVL